MILTRFAPRLASPVRRGWARALSSSSPPPSSPSDRSMRKRRRPRDLVNAKPSPTSFLVPATKALVCAAAFAISVRFARPLSVLLSKPIFLFGAGGMLLAGALRRYGGLSWRASFASAAIVFSGLAAGISLYNMNISPSVLEEGHKARLVNEAISILEGNLGSPVRAIGIKSSSVTSTKTKKNGILVNAIRINSWSHLYTNDWS